jgi:hypothetical protein
MQITAEPSFDANSMHLSMMLYGFYCYHDTVLENIVPKDIVFDTSFTQFGEYGITTCEDATNILIKTQQPKYEECFGKLILDRSVVYFGIDNGVGIWHTDHRENIKIQAMCYQSDLNENDGGSLRMKCYDGVERWYYPKNGDVVLTNHSPDVVHKIDKLLTDKKRIVINMVLK